MSRTLDDDFGDDGPGGGTLDIEKGSQTGAGRDGGGGATSYDGSGMEFDDDFGEAGSGKALELDLPVAPPGPPARLSGTMNAVVPPPARPSGTMNAVVPPPRPSGTMNAVVPPPRSSGTMNAVVPPVATTTPPPGGPAPPGPSAYPEAPAVAAHVPTSKPTAAAIIAQYPEPPSEVWQAPKYAIQIVLRQLELRSNLESLRRRRSPDVPLYEAALRSYDAKTFRLGLALNVAIFAVGTFLILFLPVYLRAD